MTERLYYQSAFLKEWTTTVSYSEKREGSWFITLAASAFYPGGGGQPEDMGTIDGMPIKSIVEEAGSTYYVLEEKPSKDEVVCRLDWERRFDHMQQHTGQHLLSAVFRSILQANTVSFHLGKEVVSIDIDMETVTPEQLASVEQAANQIIVDQRQLSSYFITAEQLANLPVVKQPKVKENIRIVEMEDIEYNPCGGTHLENTGQLGLLKIMKTERHKAGMRIYFKSGKRALADFQNALQILSSLEASYNTNRESLIDRINKQSQLLQEQKKENKLLTEQLESFELERLSQRDEPVISEYFETKSSKELQRLCAKLLQQRSAVVLFASSKEKKAILQQNTDVLRCGSYVKSYLTTHHGKGGGNDQTAQVSFENQNDLQTFMEETKSYLLEQIK